MSAAMADFEPSLRPIEPTPLSRVPARQRRGNGRGFDLERELESKDTAAEEPPPTASTDPDAPVAPREADEAGGRLDVTA